VTPGEPARDLSRVPGEGRRRPGRGLGELAANLWVAGHLVAFVVMVVRGASRLRALLGG
jgi:hypothetical protein